MSELNLAAKSWTQVSNSIATRPGKCLNLTLDVRRLESLNLPWMV